MRVRSELLKLISDKVVFCLYKPEKTMKRIKDVIDEIVELHDAFKFKVKKDDAEVVRNYIFGIPPEDD